MTRFEEKPNVRVATAMIVATVAVFVADVLTPLGIAVWVAYLVPVGLTLFLWRPAWPVWMGAITTVLMVIGYFLSPPGARPDIARMNRAFGVITVWGLVLVSRQSIIGKLLVRKEQWLHQGQMQLTERVRGEYNLHELGEKVLRFLGEYLDAHAGAIFVEENGILRRVATYAVPSDGSVPEFVRPGEGLLGQAVKDGRSFVVNDLPEGYITVGSALGGVRPRRLLISPLTADGTVNSVLELGLVHPVFGSDTELLDRTAESIGIAVRSAKDRTRLQQLLAETQSQAEELQAQSEELRVSNEELTEQSRALNESQTRLELQQTELEQSNQNLEEQTQLLEAQKEALNRSKQELERQSRELEQASRYKSSFLANMSHELRTPLNSSLILAKLLAENSQGNLTEEQVKYAQTIESAGNDLLRLITDILDLSKIEAGRMDVKPECVPVRRILENLQRTFQPLAAEKGLEFRTGTAPEAPEMIETDPQRLEQVLKNIIANAIKFTERGEVNVEVRRESPGLLAFSIRDTGIGISAEQHQAIFEPFRQADGRTNRKYGGTGLGLSISREFARLLGGRIELASELGRGSAFTVLLPETYPGTPGEDSHAKGTQAQAVVSGDRGGTTAAPQTSAGNADVAQEAGRGAAPGAEARAGVAVKRAMDDDRDHLTGAGRVILVVEDDHCFAGILYGLAHELGFQCLVADTAAEALDLAKRFSPSAVLLDVILPDNSGLSVLDRLKADVRTRHVPVHVISGSDNAERALAMGAVGYMLKPVKREQLVEAFKQLETKLTQRLRRVLVVEDDPVQLDCLRQLLSSRDVETLGARSAAECLEVLKGTLVDCMVLDLNLPDASGFALLETLSHHEAYQFPPVIIYTGRELGAEEEQQLRKYSKSIIIKGAKSPERLLDEVILFLHQVVAELPAEQRKLLQKAWSRDAALEGKRILVVEDDVRNVFAVSSILEPRGAVVAIARNGREALEALEKSKAPNAHRIDLVLMDIMMPEMDGLTAIREIRKQSEWNKLPIIALTAKAMKSDQEQCLEAGANDYMAKPLDVDKLLSLVRVWIPR